MAAFAIGCATGRDRTSGTFLPTAPNWTVRLGKGALATDSQKREVRFSGLVLSIERSGPTLIVVVRPDDGSDPIAVQVQIGPLAQPGPLTAGERVHVLYREFSAPTVRNRRAGVLITDGAQVVRLLFQDGELFEEALIPESLRLSPDREVAYTVARRLDGVCYAVIEHRALRTPAGKLLVPGDAPQSIEAGAVLYRAVVVDNLSITRTDCPDTSRSRITWIAAWHPPQLPFGADEPYEEELPPDDEPPLLDP